MLNNTFLFVILLGLAFAIPAQAQFFTAGVGALVSERPTETVYELHGETPQLAGLRGYLTLSWTDDIRQPTFISAIERPVFKLGSTFTGLGAGLLWVEANEYNPYPVLVSSTLIPLPLPKTSFVVIGSTLPFEDFDWSLVLKVGVTLVFIR